MLVMWSLQAAGVSLLTVHGRTKEEKKHAVGLCDWFNGRGPPLVLSMLCRDAVAEVKKALEIPVILNGGIMDLSDYERCVDG